MDTIMITMWMILTLVTLGTISEARPPPPCSNDIKVVADKPFNISCKFENDGKKDLHPLLKYRNGTEFPNYQLNYTFKYINESASEVVANFQGFPPDFVIKARWDLPGARRFEIKTGRPPEKPELRIDETKCFNYENISICWDLHPDNKDNFQITEYYAELKIKGINGTTGIKCEPIFKFDASRVYCASQLKEPPGANATLGIHLVSNKSDIKAVSEADIELPLDKYFIPGPVQQIEVDEIDQSAQKGQRQRRSIDRASAPRKSVFTWLPPTNAALEYIVTVDGNQWTVDKPTMTVEGLCPNSEYSLSVQAISTYSKAGQPTTKKFNTSCTAPHPVRVASTSYHITPTEKKDFFNVTVFWMMPKCWYGCDDTTFQVNLFSVSSDNNEAIPVKSFEVAGDRRSLEICDLKNHYSSTYHVNVSATNREGRSKNSADIIICTSKSCDVKPPHNFTVIWSKTHLRVSWNEKNMALPSKFTVYAAIGEDEATRLNSTRNGDRMVYSKMFFEKVHGRNALTLRLCEELNDTILIRQKNDTFISPKEECISLKDKDKTKIGIAYENKEIISPIFWATCFYDNSEPVEVPEMDVEADSTSITVKLEKGVSPCQKPGRYIHDYYVQVKSKNSTDHAVPVKVKLNRNEKTYTVYNLQSKHDYNVDLLGLTEGEEIKLKTLSIATTEYKPSLMIVAYVVAPLVAFIVMVLGVTWFTRRIKKKKRILQKIPPHNDDLSGGESDAEEREMTPLEDGNYNIIDDGSLEDPFERIPMINRWSDISRKDLRFSKSEEDPDGDSAIGTDSNKAEEVVIPEGTSKNFNVQDYSNKLGGRGVGESDEAPESSSDNRAGEESNEPVNGSNCESNSESNGGQNDLLVAHDSTENSADSDVLNHINRPVLDPQPMGLINNSNANRLANRHTSRHNTDSTAVSPEESSTGESSARSSDPSTEESQTSESDNFLLQCLPDTSQESGDSQKDSDNFNTHPGQPNAENDITSIFCGGCNQEQLPIFGAHQDINDSEDDSASLNPMIGSNEESDHESSDYK